MKESATSSSPATATATTGLLSAKEFHQRQRKRSARSSGRNRSSQGKIVGANDGGVTTPRPSSALSTASSIFSSASTPLSGRRETPATRDHLFAAGGDTGSVSSVNLLLALNQSIEKSREEAKVLHQELIAEAEFLFRIKSMISNQKSRLQTEKVILSRNLESMMEAQTIAKPKNKSHLETSGRGEVHAGKSCSDVDTIMDGIDFSFDMPSFKAGEDHDDDDHRDYPFHDEAYLKALSEMKSFLASKEEAVQLDGDES